MVTNIHKKGTISKCENYRVITLLPTAYKLFANIIRNKLNEYLGNEIIEKQCGFRTGRSCTDAIFTVQQIIEKRKEHNLPLCILFVNYEKAYDNVNRDKMWKMMENKVPNYLLNTIKTFTGTQRLELNLTKIYLN
jgi:hypothetical protein